jgi:hypothetical protein
MDYKAYFQRYADAQYLDDSGKPRQIQGAAPTEEERYQAFEARILAKLEERRIAMCADDWKPTFGE